MITVGAQTGAGTMKLPAPRESPQRLRQLGWRLPRFTIGGSLFAVGAAVAQVDRRDRQISSIQRALRCAIGGVMQSFDRRTTTAP